MIKLYGRGQSRSFRALWALNEAGIPCEHIEVTDAVRDSDAYAAINPQRKVPSLVDADLTLTESAAMVNYAGHLSGTLIPTSPKERAQYDEVCYFIMSDFEQPLWTIGKHRFALPEAQRREAIFDTALWEFEKSQKALQQRLGNREFAVGTRFTLADVLVAHTLNWAMRFEMPVAPQLLDYRANHYARKACVASLAALEA